MDAAGIAKGQVFRPINRGGRVIDAMLTPETAAKIVKDAAERAGLDPADFERSTLIDSLARIGWSPCVRA
jgi:hypothetical protein